MTVTVPAPPGARPRSRVDWRLPLLALTSFGLAAGIRAIPWALVFTDEGVVFTEGDSYSHMWRIWNAASKSIPLSARDPWVNFPRGGEVLWPPAFDAILATAVRWLGLDQSAAERLCAWAPLVLGALAVALAAVIAARTFSLRAGWGTGLLLAILPGSFLYTQVGYLDHHAAIALVGTALLGGAMHVVAVGPSGPRLWPLVAGALCAFALLLWAGALLHIAVLQLALGVWAVSPESRETASMRVRGLALAHAVVALAILPFSLREWTVFGHFSPLALTRFQPTYYGAAAVVLAASTLAWRIPRLGARRATRTATVLALGAVGLVLAFAFIDELGAVLRGSAGWFTEDVAFLTNIVELAPLFSSEQPRVWLRAFRLLSPLFVLFPLAFAVLAWRADRPEKRVLLCWTAAFGALTLDQSRFVNTFCIAYAIVWGGAIDVLFEAVPRRIARPAARRAAGAVLASLLVASVVVPAALYYLPRITLAEAAPMQVRRAARRDIARFLARQRPVPLDAQGRPMAAVLCAWSGGHELRYYSGWPTNQDGFGPYVSPENTLRARRYFRATDEDRAIGILEQMGTRYVLAENIGAGDPPYPPPSLARRLVDSAGSGAEIRMRRSGDTRWIPALTRHRLVDARPNRRGGAWLYEVVPGARVVGTTAPRSRVDVELDLRTPHGGRRTWQTRARADAEGHFELRLPYATVGAPPAGFMPEGDYRVRTADGTRALAVPEAAVQTGATLALPDAAADGRPASVGDPAPQGDASRRSDAAP
jgi:dolichyl-diphosphooligosaccharide--protein glycosyltransferase